MHIYLDYFFYRYFEFFLYSVYSTTDLERALFDSMEMNHRYQMCSSTERYLQHDPMEFFGKMFEDSEKAKLKLISKLICINCNESSILEVSSMISIVVRSIL